MSSVLTKSDLAKYPFVPEATEYIRMLDLQIGSLANPEFKPILDRAESRIIEALSNNPPIVSYRIRDDDVEIVSFPVAVMMAAATANETIKRRYALAEARRAYNLLRFEDKNKLMEVAKAFDWRIELANRNEATMLRSYDFKLHFLDYLKNTKSLRDKSWKLINRTLIGGMVYLTIREAARLLQEEVRRHIEAKLQTNVRLTLPPNVAERVDKIKQMYADQIGRVKVKVEEAPKGLLSEALPPCIKTLYQSVSSGHHISHIGRFALTSFLLNIGMETDRIIDLFRSFSDFDERMTRYQVEHIAGERGSRTKYTPPSCDTLKTHGICPGMDDLCRRVRHPLTYYRRKLRRLRRVKRVAKQAEPAE